MNILNMMTSIDQWIFQNIRELIHAQKKMIPSRSKKFLLRKLYPKNNH